MDYPDPLAPDDVLAQPTRARLFGLLEELRRPATTRELAGQVNLHPNGVRMHLELLAEAGLVKRARVRQGRGRPADAWTVAPAARPGGCAPRGYRELGRWLARALASSRLGLPGIEETGRQIGRELAPSPSADVPQLLDSTFSALGFQPQVRRKTGSTLSVCLANCPYRDAVRENQPAVCALHKGITAGLLERLAPGSRLTEFTAQDPEAAGCMIEVHLSGSSAAS